ncbi:MAG: UDP-N-acetylglucosamine pyrophosphorylase, partial [Lachnospiraceae bacterium]|nr:UDP-N-acetylglucosamine pyrophosphorylase [Lachnospiraceae bacterium]
MIKIKDLFDLDHTLARDYLKQFTYPWEALKGIKDFILALGPTLDPAEYTEVSEHVWVHKTATVCPSAYLGAPCLLG